MSRRPVTFAVELRGVRFVSLEHMQHPGNGDNGLFMSPALLECKQGFRVVMKVAEQGEAGAEYIVGGCYKYDIGVPVDTNKGNEWLKKAANMVAKGLNMSLE